MDLTPLKNYLNKINLLVPCIDKKCHEYYLFYGTSNETISTILRTNFTHDYFDDSVYREMYFSDHSSKSNQSVPCPKCNQGINVINSPPCNCQPESITDDYKILLCRVCLANPFICKNYLEETFTRPERRLDHYDDLIPLDECILKDTNNKHHSIISEGERDGMPTKLRDIIVNDRTQIYPEYIISYKRSPTRLDV